MYAKLLPFLFLLFTIGCQDSYDSAILELQNENTQKNPSEKYLKGGNEKCPVCHRKNDGSFKLLDVSCNAVSNHLNHGDGQPGGSVPGQEGFIFGDQCELVELQEDCPCFTLQELVDSDWSSYSACDGTDIAGYLGRGSYIYQSVRDQLCGSSYTIVGVVSHTTPGEMDDCLEIVRQAIQARGVPMVNGACDALEDWMEFDVLHNL